MTGLPLEMPQMRRPDHAAKANIPADGSAASPPASLGERFSAILQRFSTSSNDARPRDPAGDAAAEQGSAAEAGDNTPSASDLLPDAALTALSEAITGQVESAASISEAMRPPFGSARAAVPFAASRQRESRELLAERLNAGEALLSPGAIGLDGAVGPNALPLPAEAAAGAPGRSSASAPLHSQRGGIWPGGRHLGTSEDTHPGQGAERSRQASAAPEADASADMLELPGALRERRLAHAAEPANARPAPGADAGAVPDLAAEPTAYRSLHAAVVRQETHFAPVQAAAASEPFGQSRRNPTATPTARSLPSQAQARVDEDVAGHLATVASRNELRDPESRAWAFGARPFGDALDRQAASPGPASRKDDGDVAMRAGSAERAEGATPAPPAALPRATLHAVAGAIVSEAQDAARSAGAGPAQGVAAALGQPSAGPVRLLSLQLNPAELGSVTVHLRLTGNSISTTIRASNAATAELLQHERQNLATLLQSAGYESALPAIEGRSDLASQMLSGDARPSQQAPQPSGDFSASAGRQDGNGSDKGSSGRGQDRPLRQESGNSDAPNGGGARADDLYV